ncbi:MAG: GNAT family N-acetyltransferase [Gammaproteobacteria bacterium]|nr:GNAT family N-acetyltransferase [Gammaproteobacteria bacterium]
MSVQWPGCAWGASSLIRKENTSDGPYVRKLLTDSFPASQEAGLVARLRTAYMLAIALVGDEDGELAGYIAFSPFTVASVAGLGLAEDRRRRGLGAQRVREGLAACRLAGCGFAVVLGDPAYYGRFGFQPGRRWGLHCAYGGGDALQALELRPGTIPASGGAVSDAPALDALA